MAGARLVLPQVTLCAASSVNVAATIRALEACMAQIDFAACKLFTDAQVTPDHPDIMVIPIAPLTSAAAYSDFLLSQIVNYVETSHCLVAQWDGHVLNAAQWRDEFLDHDYIGASWPQFTDGHDVGNGGFSLRSRRLMEACREPEFAAVHPEDIAIGRVGRARLEGRGMRFAPRALADMFATERAGDLASSFGYHGVWHMPRAIGTEAFWNVYSTLDDRSTIRHDFVVLLKQVLQGRRGQVCALRMIADRVLDAIGLHQRP
ncbi:MAG: hypothetical protein A2095_11665 [Sphingomonadales bacterium GWF1_63_6]|nr:MAG: hypothetical protein A2095_11665 [Sphingomonadales bacterium GWF1_63_6]OHD02860.1 MAG: hypothetical protein A3H25_01295 [Sphingomonadales bacterium RIFCSPLOWO2_12_FULL_63_15]